MSDLGDQRDHLLDDRVPGLAITALRQSGRRIDDEVLAHIWPTYHENVHFYCGAPHTVDIAAELAALDATGYRSLRKPWTDRR